MCSPCRGAPTHPATALAVIPSPRFIHRRGLKASPEDGAVQLANKANTSRLDGELHGGEVTGTLLLKQAPLQFTAAAAAPPAGLYVYLDEGVRNSWIIDANGVVTDATARIQLPPASNSPPTDRMPVTVPPSSGGSIAVVVAVVVGALAAIGLGVFGKVHDPRFFSINVAGFSSPMAVKAWLQRWWLRWHCSNFCPR
jgi:hypothetical protein